MKRNAVTRLRLEDGHSVREACRALGFSRSSHYESKNCAERRAKTEAPIVKAIAKVQEHRYKKFYGSPRMADELCESGHRLTRHQTARLMNKYNLPAAKHRRFIKTTDSAHREPVAENLLGRNFDVGAGNHAWCGDITYLRTETGWIYMAAVLDLSTRKWVGYAVAPNMKTNLVKSALDMALYQESEQPELMHTDRGVQYASSEHRDMLRKNGITLSMSGKGECWDRDTMAVVHPIFA